jgi:hypothetical protein
MLALKERGIDLVKWFSLVMAVMLLLLGCNAITGCTTPVSDNTSIPSSSPTIPPFETAVFPVYASKLPSVTFECPEREKVAYSENTSWASDNRVIIDYPPPELIQATIAFSSLPRYGEEVECTLVFSFSESLVNVKIWLTLGYQQIKGNYADYLRLVDVPVEQAFTSGQTSWETVQVKKDSVVRMKSILRFPREGLWTFGVHGDAKNLYHPLDCSHSIIVLDGTAAVYKLGEMESTPYAYLDYFDYSDSIQRYLYEKYPVSLVVDIPHPPLADEEVTLIYRAFAENNIKGLTVKSTFKKKDEWGRVTAYPSKDVIVSSELPLVTGIAQNVYWPE